MTLSVQKLSASLQSVCLCWTNRLCVASFGLMNGRNTCSFRKAICSPAAQPQLDRHLTATLKRKLCPPPIPHTPPCLFAFSFPFFFFVFFIRQALKLGRDTCLVVSMVWIMLVLLLEQAIYWWVWHSKWEILGNLAKLNANSLHFSFFTGSRSWESL